MRVIIAVFLLSTLFGFAQKAPKPINSVDIYKKAMELYKEENYKEALTELEKIDRNDTNYTETLLKKVVINLSLEQHDEAIKLCKEGVALNSPETYNFYINHGVALMRSKKNAEAMVILDEAIKKFPRNHLLRFNRAVACKEAGKLEEAVEMYKSAINLNPYHASSHLNLGVIAMGEGKVSQAMLSLSMFLMLEPNSKRSLNVLAKLNEIVSSKYEYEPKNLNLSPEGGDDFSEQDLIINNYAALSDKFKVPVKTELPVIKQSYALFSKLSYDKNDKGFWMRTYVPFFQEVYKKEWFDEYAYFILQSASEEKVKELVANNVSAINRFVSWGGDYFAVSQSVKNLEVNGVRKDWSVGYDSETHTLEYIADSKSKEGKLNGYYENYYANGTKATKGQFNKDGGYEGQWEYYYKSGALYQQVTYKQDKLNGPFKSFYEDGTLKREGEYKDGKQNGLQKDYNKAGFLNEQTGLKDNVMEGKFAINYDFDPAVKFYEGSYVQDKLADSSFKYYDDGKLYSRKKFTEGIITGNEIIYHRNGKILAVANYTEGKYDGEYKSYYDNGQLELEGKYKNGSEVGTWKAYYPDGKLKEETQYDERGKKNGIIKVYDWDGKIHYEMTFSKGDVAGYKYFNKKGEVLKEATRQKGEFDFVEYSPDGVKKTEGVYSTDGKKGPWKYYDDFGNLASEENYDNNGHIEGVLKRYYSSGKLKEETAFDNNESDGYYATYYPNGQVSSDGWNAGGNSYGYWYHYYMNGKPESVNYYVNDKIKGYQQYFDLKGRMDREELYENGKRSKVIFYDTLGGVRETFNFKSGTGNYLSHHANGKQKFSGKYILGMAHGDFTWQSEKGTVLKSGTYYNNNEQGTWKAFYRDGVLKRSGDYVHGEQEGIWKYYEPNGKLEKTYTYVKGKLEGEAVWYYDNGKVEVKKMFRDGEEEGVANYYEEGGEQQQVRYYSKGKPVAYTYYGKDGKLVTLIDISGGTYKCVAYYKNGNKSMEYEAAKGMYQETFFEYYPSGTVCVSRKYKDGEYHGPEITYYPDGKIKTEANYNSGEIDGTEKSYFPNGKVEKEREYVMGNLHGLSRYYNNTGKLIRTEMYNTNEIVEEKNF